MSKHRQLSQAAVKQELANAFGMKDASLATFPDVIEVEKLKGFFVKHKVQGAHLTIFCVDKLWSNGYSPNGSFARGLDLAFISSQRGPNTSAHEAAGEAPGGKFRLISSRSSATSPASIRDQTEAGITPGVECRLWGQVTTSGL